MRKWIWFINLWFLLASSAYAADKAYLLTINGAIGPATQDYIKRGIETAEKEHATFIILQLNTPGGLDSSMRDVNQIIINSPIPIITYVPTGARAASAGTFIMYASHLSAMAPGTNIGAAAPVSITGSKDEAAKKPSTEEQKAVNDASAYMRSLAQLRGRNADWGESAVRKAASLSAEEAKKLNVINEVAENQEQLLSKLNGQTVVVKGVSKKINTKDIKVESMPPDWRYEFLAFLTNPNIAYILMLIAMYGLFSELSNPGLVLPGVVGIIALLLVLYAFQLMPINYTGLALIAVGIAFMVFEVYVSSFGVIGVGGIIAFIIGSVMLFDTNDPNYKITLSLIIFMSTISLVFFFMLIMLAIRSHKKAIVTGREGLIGSNGVVLSVMNKQIVVRVLGEIWEAKSEEFLNPGEKVTVTHVHGLTLEVKPLEKKEGD